MFRHARACLNIYNPAYFKEKFDGILDLPLKMMKNEITGVHWNKFSPLDFHMQVEASGTQLLHISKTLFKNGMRY